MGDMAGKLQRWFAAAVAGVTLTLLIPAQAWAAEPGVPQLVIEAARKSRRGGIGFGIIGLLCCLGVIAAVVVAFVLISRKRKRR
ncbi:hypothetical protein QLQ12_04745 [Actinoplanes sp. NEAU-A12]|uniref:DUF4190 domain-containing protein n=1 Tax=Actinoplanes sandaracinus TaxID=3045177 RepID=A0ABT6WDY4_9ACTN|nr:hypothetical protein [Actinoplanes sandaracinus]MDI6097908.1 hypothetical protein [Actinoplanes sandaracinus]